MPRRLTPFQVRLELYLQDQATHGRSAADVARDDLKISPAMLTDYRTGDSLPSSRDMDRALVFMRLFDLDTAAWYTMIGESQRLRAEDDKIRELDLQRAVDAARREERRPRRPFRGGAAAAQEAPRPRREQPPAVARRVLAHGTKAANRSGRTRAAAPTGGNRRDRRPLIGRDGYHPERWAA